MYIKLCIFKIIIFIFNKLTGTQNFDTYMLLPYTGSV